MSASFALDHVAFGLPDAEAATPLLAGQLGGRPVGSGPGPGYRFWQWEYAAGARLEVIAPDGPPGGFMHRFLERQGPGIHHVTFKVPDLFEATRHAESLGYEIVGLSTEFPSWKEAFLHPRQAQGIVVQLAESHPELEPDDWEPPAFPEPPATAGPPARLVGLRVVSNSAERARRQWSEALLGSCREGGGELLFEWPDSPLRVAARIDADATEGPLGLELAAPPDGGLPKGPHPALGTRLLPLG